MCVLTAWLKTKPPNVSVCARPFHSHVIHDERLIVRSLSVSSCLSFSCFFPSFTSSLPHSTCTLTSTSSPMSTASRELTTDAFAQRGVLPHGDIPSSHRLWAQRSWRLPLLRDFCNDLPGWIRRHWLRSPRICVTRNSTMRPLEKRYLHHCSFRSEKNQRIGD